VGLVSFAATRLGRFLLTTHGLRRGLHSNAASRLTSRGEPGTAGWPIRQAQDVADANLLLATQPSVFPWMKNSTAAPNPALKCCIPAG
jgi:hypothetical protein